MTDKEQMQSLTIEAYDDYLMRTEKRGISYGEILYIQGLTKPQLRQFYQELEEVYYEL